MNIYIALVHHPVTNKRGATVTTSVTNVDIHDLARSARTYGVQAYFIVTPIAEQRSLVGRIASHWGEAGKRINPFRAEAIELVRVAPDLDRVIETIGELEGTADKPLVVATGAAYGSAPDGSGADERDRIITYEALSERLERQSGAALVLFGTGWGLADSVTARADLLLPGIRARAGLSTYNHLSVRSAAAIILDRLVGERV